MCTPCHYAREIARGCHDNARRALADYVPPVPLGMPASYVALRLGVTVPHVLRLIRDGHLDVFPGRGIKLVTAESWRRYLASAGVRREAS